MGAFAIVLSMLAVGVFSAYAAEITATVTKLAVPRHRVRNGIGGAILAGAVAWSLGPSAVLVAWVPIVAVGAVLSAIDVVHHRLPDRLVLPLYPIVAVLLLIPVATGSPVSMYVRALIAMVVMFGVYFGLALVYPAGMGFGDVKFAGVLGLGLGFLGWDFVFVGFVAAFLIASVVSIGLMVSRRISRKSAIAFGPFMLVGAVGTLVFAALVSR